ncbi:MAG: 2Fe-2S iron-sulfur cluster binding domain-containing protein [bacterium]
MVISILISTGFVSGVSVLLALLLVIAEKKVLNYGPCEIDINNGKKKIKTKGGGSLLFALAEEGVFIPSACGGQGTCAYCKIKIPEGGGVINPVEAPYLSPEELKENVRLCCQIRVRNDLKIQIPPELFLIKHYSGTLISKKQLTHDIIQLKIQLSDSQNMNFSAGQYVQLESEEYNGINSVKRGYSIASSPENTREIVLIVRRVPHGICTTWVFDHLKTGQSVYLSGPYGEFMLSDTNAPAIFIAGGSGMAPMLSMLEYIRFAGLRRKITFFFGAVEQRDLFFTDELNNMQEQIPDFIFIPALSNEPSGSTWKGERGLITEVVDRHFTDVSRHEAYLCGSPGMIDACLKVLIGKNIKQENIFYDKF